MKHYLGSVDLAIWLALIAGKIVLCLCIFKKRLYQRMPWFSSYVVTSTANSLLLLSAAFLTSYMVYYYIFYVAGHIVSLTAFLALIESGRRVLPGLNLPRKERAIVLLVASACGVLTFVTLWPLHFIENRIELGAQLIVGLAFIFVAIYSRYLGLYWSKLLAGISATLGFLYLIQGVTQAISWHYPLALTIQVRQISQIANVLAVIAWIVVVLSPWGESVMTEEDLQILEAAFAKIEDSLGTQRVKAL
jgi:hypothetical protein